MSYVRKILQKKIEPLMENTIGMSSLYQAVKRCFLLNTFLKTFYINVPFLYPLKTSENLRFCDVFRGYRNGTLAQKGLILTVPQQLFIINNRLHNIQSHIFSKNFIASAKLHVTEMGN